MEISIHQITEIELFQLLAKHAPLWQEWLNPEGICIYISPYCEEISGYRAEEFLQDPTLLEQITHSEDRKKLNEFLSASAQLVDINLSLRIFHREEGIRWIHGSSYTIYNLDGLLVGTYRYFQDLSDLKLLEYEKNKIDNLVHALLNTPNDITFIINTEGEIAYLGEMMAKRIGLSSDEIIGKYLWDFFTPQVAEYRKGWIDQVLTSKKPLRTEDNQTLGEGPPAYYDTWMYPILNDKDEITHIVIMSRDISPLKRTQHELHDSKRKLEVILEGVANGIYVMDQSGKLIYANQAASHHLIDSMSEFIAAPKKFYDKYIILDESGNPISWNALPAWAALSGKQTSPVILRYKENQEDADHWLRVKATPVYDDNKNIQFAVIITEDITELKQVHQELEKTQKELEDRIFLRTAELYQAVQDLQVEIETRKKAEQKAKQNAAHAKALSHVAARLNAQLGLDVLVH